MASTRIAVFLFDGYRPHHDAIARIPSKATGLYRIRLNAQGLVR